MFRSLTLLAGGLVLLSAVPLHADDAILSQMYGSGVHAYFSRDYVKAHGYLTASMEGGSGDPRCYYFRGLAYIKLGRETEAEMDFEKGAELESRDGNQFYNVAKSLERIQGRTRLALEQHRVKARMAALKRAEKVRKARYEAIRAEEGRVLDAQIHPPPKQPRGVPGVEKRPGGLLGAMGRALGKAVGGEGEGPTVDDPFAVGPLEEPVAEPVVQPADLPGAPPEAEPSATPPRVEPAEDDPFAEDEAAAPTPPEKTAAPEPTPPPAEDDPFAEDEAAAPAPPEKTPAPEPTPPAPEDDPFAEDDAAEPGPTEEKPAP